MKQIQTIEEEQARLFDREVNQALSEGWGIVKRYRQDGKYIAELEREEITEDERSCENCKYFACSSEKEPCASCNSNADKWEEAR